MGAIMVVVVVLESIQSLYPAKHPLLAQVPSALQLIQLATGHTLHLLTNVL